MLMAEGPEARLTLARNISATILIFDGDPVLGRALELLLRTAGYDARYVTSNYTEQATTFNGLRILLLGPGWDARSRAATEKMAGARRVAITPILEMGAPLTALRRSRNGSCPGLAGQKI